MENVINTDRFVCRYSFMDSANEYKSEVLLFNQVPLNDKGEVHKGEMKLRIMEALRNQGKGFSNVAIKYVNKVA